MEDLRDVKHSVKRNDYLVKIDLKKAFWSIRLSERLKKYIRFRHQGQLYEANTMMFGLSVAPLVFTKVMKVPMSLLRHLNFRIHIYIDDMILMASSLEEILQARDTTIYLLQTLGLTINFNKSVLIPTHNLVYLGINVDSQLLTFHVPPEKVQKLKEKCKNLKQVKKPTIREVSSTMGALRATSIAFTPAPIQLRNMQQLIKSSLATHRHYEAKVNLDKSTLQELSWWISSMDTYNGKPMSIEPPEMIISTDASMTGWGAHCNGQDAGGKWTQEDLKNLHHINELELEATKRGILTFTRIHTKVRSIHLQIDNKNALIYLLKQGGKTNQTMNNIAKQIWEYLMKNKISITGEYIPSELNIHADRMSRSTDLSEWKLETKIFTTICKKLGQPEIDLFASLATHQLDKYVSWKPDPQAVGTDAFQFNWTHLLTYAFPPFKLIGRTLSKLQSHQSDMIIVTPIWRSQSWYPQLLQMSIKHPLLLPNHKNLLTDPTGKRCPLLEQKNLQHG